MSDEVMKAIRWSDNDRYFGPFTYARERYGKFAIMLGSGDGDDYPGCRLRVSLGKTTLIAALPPIIKPFKRWVDTSRYEWSKSPNSGYWEVEEREFGFSVFESALHVHYGAQLNEWPGCKSKVFFAPWREHRCVRHSLYDLEGEHFADLPEWGFRSKNGWTVKQAIEDACPVAKFEFIDFDGEHIAATTRIEEREWKRGMGLFRLFFLGRNHIGRSLDLRFSTEVGQRKGSWKGGTVGHSIDMLPGELHEAAFRRYCHANGLTFVAPSINTRPTVVTDEVVERVARAIAAAQYPDELPFDCLSPETQEEYRRAARAAIAAMQSQDNSNG